MKKFNSFKSLLNAYPKVGFQYKADFLFLGPVECNEDSITIDYSTTIVDLKSGRIFYLYDTIYDVFNEKEFYSRLRDKENIINVGVYYKDKYISNADDDLYHIHKDQITVSFTCLQRLICPERPIDDIYEYFSSGKLKILDYEKDKRYKVKGTETKEFLENKIKQGYYSALIQRETRKSTIDMELIIGSIMHRSPYCLLEYDKRKFLVGVDDSQYFGVELASKDINTIKEALNDLRPAGVPVKNYHRQGEWFVYPCDLPADKYTGIELNPVGCCADKTLINFVLPQDSENSNDHACSVKQVFVINNELYVSGPGEIVHNEHSTLYLGSKIYKIVKNTALQSVSVDGVD